MIKKLLLGVAMGTLLLGTSSVSQALIITNEDPDRHGYVVDGERNEQESFLLHDMVDDLSGWGWRSTVGAIDAYNADGTIPPMQFQNVTLITPKHVMATRHWDLHANKDYVFMGTDGRYYGSKVHHDTSIRVFSSNGQIASDLAIYELQNEIPTEFVKPLFLADDIDVYGQNPWEATLYVAGREKIVGLNYPGPQTNFGSITLFLRYGTAEPGPDDVGVSEDQDSGSATFIKHDGRLHVVGVRYGYVLDTAVEFYYDSIAQIIDDYNAANGTNYALNQDYSNGQGKPSIADLDRNGVVNEDDVRIFVTALHNNDPIADIVPEFGSIDYLDISAFLKAYRLDSEQQEQERDDTNEPAQKQKPKASMAVTK